MLQRLLQAWCYPCIFVGVGLFLLSGSIYAQVATAAGVPPVVAQVEHLAISNQSLIQMLFGLVLSLGGAYVAGMKKQFEKDIAVLTKAVETLRTNVHEIEVDLPTDYHTKDDMARQLKPISDSLNELHRRLDERGFPRPSKS